MKRANHVILAAAMLACAAFGGADSPKQPKPSNPSKLAPAVLDAMVRVNEKWQSAHPLSGNWGGKPYAEESPFWNKAAYHIGNLASSRVDSPVLKEHGLNDKWRAYSQRWAEGAQWKGARGEDKARWRYSYGEKPEFVLFGDWQACFQAYAELDGDLARALEVFDHEASLEATDFIWWADGIFMVMPTMTHLALRYPDRREKYLERLAAYWKHARDLMRDGETGLFFRDARYIYPKHATARGIKDFWARGNGWVAAALARAIDDLDAMGEKELRAEFAGVFRSLMDRVIACQQPEGHWTRSLLDPEQAPGFETSGTAFFAYALAWGVEKRLVDEKAALNSLDKAWRYLLGKAVQGDGSLGYVQPIGDRAVPGQVVDARSEADFGVGAFLLAASTLLEMRQSFEGVIVFARGGDRFAFMRLDDGRAARLWLEPGNQVWFGDRVTATGIVEQEYPVLRITGVTIAKHGHAELPSTIETTIGQLLSAPRDAAGNDNLYGRCVALAARVQDVNRRRTQVQLFVVDAQERGLTASFGIKENEALDPELKRGAFVSLWGVPSMTYQLDDGGAIESVGDVTLNMTGAWNVKVLNPAPWWTPERIWAAAIASAIVVGFLFFCVVFLGIVVRRKAAQLAETMRLQHEERLEADAARRERLRLAHDLHDDFQQLLTGAMFQLNAGMNILEDGQDEPSALAHLESARLALQHTQTGLRTVLWTMREESEGPASLLDLFKYAAGRMPHWRGRVGFTQSGQAHPLARKVTGSLLMILQEAVGNALRHGKATHVDVSVDYGAQSLSVKIANDGLPFSPGAAPGPEQGHFGLESMRQRAEELGGTLTIKTNGRVCVAVEIPYEQEASE